MLPRADRIRTANDFRHAVRQGGRTGRPTLVVHAVRAGIAHHGVRVGFVVAKPVGNAVMRNRVKRRLRHLVLAYLLDTPAGTDVVVRALPRAATHPAEVGRDLEQAWSKVMDRVRSEVTEVGHRSRS